MRRLGAVRSSLGPADGRADRAGLGRCPRRGGVGIGPEEGCVGAGGGTRTGKVHQLTLLTGFVALTWFLVQWNLLGWHYT